MSDPIYWYNGTSAGVVGPVTWNKLYSVYRGVTDNIAVPQEPQKPQGGSQAYPGTLLRPGATGHSVALMQRYLNKVRALYTNIPRLGEDGIFGAETRRAVIAFQNQFMLRPDGIIGPATWNKIVEEYNIASGGVDNGNRAGYPGSPMWLGASGGNVRFMQQCLSDLREKYPSIPAVSGDGVFGLKTQAATVAFQRLMGLDADGVIGQKTWGAVMAQFARRQTRERY